MTSKDRTPRQQNEGEGNRTAARRFNEAEQRFARSGKVEEKAKAAERALEGKEGEALKEAELIGKRHAADEDPDVKR
jgi:hypothetical protein